jgi:PKD repeat protein
VYPGDLPPVNVEGLFSPPNGTVFTDGRIFVSGRFEDDQQMAQAQVAIINNLGQYMSSSGTFTSTTASWRGAFLTSPGSPGSNFSYTSPVIPAGTYTVMARGVDQHGFITTAPPTSTVSVTLPPNNPPVAAFTYTCTANVCSFDGRTSTDENAATLTYSWNFGTGQGTGSGPVPTKTYTAPGNPFTVTLTVRDEWNVTATTTQSLVMVEPAGNLPPVPVINQPSCAARQCNFSGVGTADPDLGDTFTYSWNFGDATTSTSTSPSKTYLVDGDFVVTLTVTDGWGNFASTTRTVPIHEPVGNLAPTAAINTPVCVGLVCNFSGLNSSDPNGDSLTYSWVWGDGTANGTGGAPAHTFTAAGSKTVTLTVSDGWGRTGTATVTFTV